MRHGSLFSGIGGFDLAAEWMGWENVFHCEWEEFPRSVLHYYWPNAESFGDIKQADFTKFHGSIDIISGGFPCQPYSQAGKRLGKDDERHLWPEMLRAIREVRPTWVVGENVLGIVNWSGGLVFEEVQTDLEAEGYEVQTYVLPAAGVNAPHQRYRTWFIAYSDRSYDRRTSGQDAGLCKEERLSERNKIRQPVESSKVQRTTSNTDVNGHTSQGKGTEAEGNWSANNGEQKERCIAAERADRFHGFSRTTAYTNNIRSSQQDKSKKQPRGAEAGATSKKYGNSDYRTTSDTDSTRRGEKRKFATIASESERFNSEKNLTSEPRSWTNFPTQPPVCSRNDGLSSQLDGITFSKWRNESIKSYGNAVVPQVVLQIFKSIAEYEQICK